MKVCHITFDHSWNDTRVYKREILSQCKAGFNVYFFGWDRPNKITRDGVQFISFYNKKLTRFERLKLFFINRALVKRILQVDADIFQFHDFTLLEVGRKLKKAGKRVIFDSHENYLSTIPAKAGKVRIIRRCVDIGLKYYYRKVVSQFDAVFTVSPNIVCQLREYNHCTYMVSNYPSLENYSFTEESVKENAFIYQGSVYQFSNQEAIVEAINLVKEDVKYLIIGNTEGNRAVIESNDIKQRVEIIGWLKKEELDKIMRRSIAGIVIFDYVPECCYQEGQVGSNKLFEYMLNGLPVICTDFKLWKDMIIDKYHCGICVKPGSVEQIRDAIEWLISNPDEARKMGERGRNAILNEFNWEKELPNYLSLYERIISM